MAVAVRGEKALHVPSASVNTLAVQGQRIDFQAVVLSGGDSAESTEPDRRHVTDWQLIEVRTSYILAMK
jgi:hypothetical protein